MVPTTRGVSVFLVAVILNGLAWITSIGWFYVAASVVWSILLVNLALPPISIFGFSAQRRLNSSTGGRSPDLFEDDVARISVDLRNRSFLPKFLVTLWEECPLAAPGNERQGFFIGSVGPRAVLTLNYDVDCHQRGVYSFGPLRVQTSAPFGLFRAGRAVHAPMQATVYPKILPIETPANEGPLQGDIATTSTPGPSGEFRGSREYQTTDSPRSIHWRNSAKQGHLMVREFDRLPQGEVRVAFNPEDDLGVGRHTTLEYAIKIAATLARRSFQDGRPFRIWPGGRDSALATWHGVLEHLARLRPSADPSIRQMLGQGRQPGASVVIVSAADRPTLGLLQQQHQAAGGFTVVLLKGFGGREDPVAQESMMQMGAKVVVCTPGLLPEAMERLGMEMASPTLVRRVPSTRRPADAALARQVRS